MANGLYDVTGVDPASIEYAYFPKVAGTAAEFAYKFLLRPEFWELAAVYCTVEVGATSLFYLRLESSSASTPSTSAPKHWMKTQTKAIR